MLGWCSKTKIGVKKEDCSDCSLKETNCEFIPDLEMTVSDLKIMYHITLANQRMKVRILRRMMDLREKNKQTKVKAWEP